MERHLKATNTKGKSNTKKGRVKCTIRRKMSVWWMDAYVDRWIDCVQANKCIWLWLGSPDVGRPVRKHGGNLEQKSIATANSSKS